ncbi:hypothetical protein P4H42_03805 [Paenibacillus macerans]|uniref:hypothetical protein n=1 Tax=Paenibacillus macerans TaxID=44252 RepID=UPI002DB55EBA|nr:hypothetical protein [Paenibacillus macerans]MEC0328748.1 hypothetical protein [Paenibacillus macerans]
MARPKITAEQRADWRNLPLEHWNVRTAHAMIIELNAEKFGVDKYIPLRGYGFEQGVIKRALAEYGAAALRITIERAFAEYKPGPQYPQLTAGFLIAYMLPRIMPQVLAEEKRKAMSEESVADAMSAEEMASWL